jgi:hypothetical protein
MDGFISGALLAVARKCEALHDVLSDLREQLPDDDESGPARRLASRQMIRMHDEAKEASRLANGIKELSGSAAADGRLIRRIALSRYRRCVAAGRFVEYCVVPFLRGFDAKSIELTQLCRQIATAVKWPHGWPLVSRAATNYFHFIAEEDDELILAPALAGNTVLPLPDLVHEMAHALVRDEERRQTILGDWCDDSYTEKRVIDALGEGAFADVAARHWLEHGVEEIACDVIAAWVTGPAYAWQHLRACWGREEGQSVYDDGVHHPPDSARFEVIQMALEKVGGSEDIPEIKEAWARIIGDHDKPGVAGFYPGHLVVELAQEILVGCVRAGIRPFPQELSETDPCHAFSDAWAEMRQNPFAFDASERAQ